MAVFKSLKTVVLALPCAGTSTMFGILDVMGSVGRDWEMLHGLAPRSPLFDVSLLSPDGRAYSDVNGRAVVPEGRLSDASANQPPPDLVIIPDLHIDVHAPFPTDLEPVAEWLRNVAAQGALITSVCSGAWLLAHAGLLDGLDATTHWAYADKIARLHPEVRMRRERILVPAGEGHRIVTAGGASAWGDLMLYLIARFGGQEEARRISKIYLLQPHTDSQLCYASLLAGRQHEDAIVAEAQVWAAGNYADPAPVAAMAKVAGLSERSLLRRFRRATGQTPVEYIQTLRVEEAKQMLETTDMSIEDIAEEVGYTETSSFRSAFRRNVGISASVYRRKHATVAPLTDTKGIA
ncbi:GlxA family transcriptional regulator [Roseobacter sinensis]|uniref:Helix-turn-helix domain-containing protein n=1 Tax=Roseobacter sinensis TaxID=2931391 RepID=A0ABT3BKX0_9RHOB|nr:helix-turn-helix domain-containing protein [Roseobacter sp. WL0113]MCV3274219.1 helix-turn-helix domain-containing protein [Roseobacter sp. WL0113]